MEPTYDSRERKNAATEKAAGTGGTNTNASVRSGAPRSWRQYIEQTMPTRDTNPAAGPREADLLQFAPTRKKRARSTWDRRVRRFTRWARECGKKARSAAAAVREKLGAAAVVCREKLSGAADAAREKLGPAAAACRKKLGHALAVCREKLGPVAAAVREKLGPAASLCLKKLLAAANLCREKLDPAVSLCRVKLGPVAKKLGGRAEKVRAAVARHPISPLLYVTLLAVVIGAAAFQGNYARAYVLEVNGQKVGIVSDEDEANAILGNVETRAASFLGAGFDYEVSVTLSPVYAAPGDLTDAAEMEDALFEEMGVYMSVGTVFVDAEDAPLEDEPAQAAPTAWAISVDGVELGAAADKSEFYRMLDDIAQPYLPADTVRYEFVEDVRVYPVDLPIGAEFDGLEPIREELSALRVEKAVYTVKKGDTFNAIAYSLDMKPYELAALNPDIKVDLLLIGQELTIQQAVPRLSVLAYTEETYEEAIPSPVEYIETADLYKGDTKVKTAGKDGLALVNAEVTYLNNAETGREILESTTLEEATTTYTYIGTTPRPATASKGYFIWPVKGTITSNFGYRYLWGSYDFHTGLDIGVPYGTTVKAADGGTVITAGWSGSYGILVAIRHDNGIVTYYAHNSSLLVKVGDKVYQGQPIAKAGSTGNSTGPHCHFEVRVNGTSVNPRPYLS